MKVFPMNVVSARIDFMDLEFKKAALFSRLVGSLSNELMPDEKPILVPTDGRTITLTFVSLGHCILFLCACKAYLEAFEDWATLARVSGAILKMGATAM
jgi:hypothetical protein